MSKKRPLAYRAVYDAQCGRCFYCGEPLPYDKATRDHFFPKARYEGHRNACNFVFACYECNTDKSDREPTLPEYARFFLLRRRAGANLFSGRAVTPRQHQAQSA